MNETTEITEIAGLDCATFVGVIMAISGLAMSLALVKLVSLPFTAIVALACAGAVVATLGNFLIMSGMRYRAVFSSFVNEPRFWLITASLMAFKGIVIVEIIALLSNSTS